jgi:citrate/tricarballylate utilization protein
LALAVALATIFLLAAWPSGNLWHAPLAGNFYAVFPHGLMVAVFGSVFGFALLAMGMGGWQFWRAQESDALHLTGAAKDAAVDIATMKNLGGGHGEGCATEDDRASLARRHFHQTTMWGFALCFAATSVATVYHYAFGWQAPYAYTSLPVLLGTVGGIGLLVGPVGLWWLGRRRHPLHRAPVQQAMDSGLLALLFATSLSGLALLALRETPAMAMLLCIHLGIVLALFAVMPYSKMVHGMYRGLALLKWHVERRKPLAHAAPE